MSTDGAAPGRSVVVAGLGVDDGHLEVWRRMFALADVQVDVSLPPDSPADGAAVSDAAMADAVVTDVSSDGAMLRLEFPRGGRRALTVALGSATGALEEPTLVLATPPGDADELREITASGIRCTIASDVSTDEIALVRTAVDDVADGASIGPTVFVAFDGSDPSGGAAIAAAASGGIVVVAGRRSPTAAAWTHGVNCLRVEPTAAGITWALRHLGQNPADAARLSLAARRSAELHGPKTLAAVLSDMTEPDRGALRKRVAIINTFAAHDPVNGGQRRLRHLAGALARHADVELFVLSQHAEHVTERILAPGLTQIEVPRSAEQKDAEDRIFDLLGEPTDDMTAADLSILTPQWRHTLEQRLPGVDLVIACHPYLAPTIPELPGVPFVYDSYNAETSFKRSVLPDDDNGRWLLAATERAERNATERADLIVACTDDDLAEIQRLDDAHHAGVVVSNGVDTDAMPFATAEQRERARWELLDLADVDAYSDRPIVSFIGSSHAPNLSAAELLIAAARRRPDWLVILAGSHTSTIAEQGRTLPDNVTLIPVFDEGLLWPLIAGATVAANPMVSGGGSNLKIFDYLAVGTPVLATPTGARGLDDPASLVELIEPTVDGIVTGLDRLTDPTTAADRAARASAGRAFVEANVSWRHLGQQWADAFGGLIGGWTGEARPPIDLSRPIILLDERPPAPDPAIAAMQRIAAASAGGHPTSREVTLDPAFREQIRLAREHRKVGRELPEGARLALPKKALIRAGHALSNEQVVYNEAALDAMERLMEVINDLQRDQLMLTERLEAAEAELATRASEARSPASNTEADLDALYEAFEDRFRGDPGAVMASSEHYLERLAGAPDGVAVDIGCGRGEWLQIVAGTGRPAVGYDTNAVAVERCVEAGLDAVHGDGIAHLERAEPGSVAIVSAFHVIEHLTFAEMHRLVTAAHRALAPGGKLVLETPNCLNLQVGASSFWLDPTHRSPVHPEQLRFLLDHTGFATVDVFGIHPDEGTTPTNLDPDPARNGLLAEFHRLVFSSVDLVAIATKG